jgi:multiple sugar transport system permease protein
MNGRAAGAAGGTERASSWRTERRGLAWMIAPYLVGLTALVFVPAALTFALSLSDADLLGTPRFRGAGNFRELLGDDVFRISLRNSLVFAAVAVPLRVGGALGLALLLYRPARGIGAARAAVFLPSVVPDVAFALAWLWILNPLYGPLNLTLEAIGAPTPAWLSEPASAQAAVILIACFQIGEGVVLALAARNMIPTDLLEVAALEGAGPFARFRRVLLPLMGPALLLLLMRDTIFAFQVSFVPALIVTEGGPPPYATTYLPLFVYRNAFEYLRYGYAASATVIMFLVTASAVWIQYRMVRRWRLAELVR